MGAYRSLSDSSSAGYPEPLGPREHEASTAGESSNGETRTHTATSAFIIADVGVLGIAGLLIGLFTGWYFIGIAFNRYHWPGLLAFVIMSLLGSHMRA